MPFNACQNRRNVPLETAAAPDILISCIPRRLQHSADTSSASPASHAVDGTVQWPSGGRAAQIAPSIP